MVSSALPEVISANTSNREIGTLNDFRQFFQMKRHETFESITPNPDVQTALRDLYEHPDKVEFYPGVFCESSKDMNADPGPSGLDSALWTAIFSDAITLVRSDRFYTVVGLKKKILTCVNDPFTDFRPGLEH